jgi:hypothetical protein
VQVQAAGSTLTLAPVSVPFSGVSVALSAPATTLAATAPPAPFSEVSERTATFWSFTLAPADELVFGGECFTKVALRAGIKLCFSPPNK